MTALEIGAVVAERRIRVTRDSLVRYAGASGDFNPIHYRDDIAEGVGLPGVLAHGMLTMGVAVAPVVDWLGPTGWVIDYGVRFTRPVIVDPTYGAELTIVASIGAIGTDADTGTARIDLTVCFADKTVLGKAQVRVRLSA